MSRESNLLRDRAAMLAAVRAFFAQKKVLEVDVPALLSAAPIDLHIEVLSLPLNAHQTRYLHTSPEYGMKRLLALGMEDIYQMSHVFRENEIGPLHNPEFTLIEWYRSNLAFSTFIEETLELLKLFLGGLPHSSFTYREIFLQHTQIDYTQATPLMLENFLREKKVEISSQESWDKDSYLNLIMSFFIEPHLGKGEITLITDYPASQAALAKTHLTHDLEEVAERFEFYHQGIELGNGYHELTDPAEQRIRFTKTNQQRQAQGKPSLPIDEYFLSALEQGLPDCYGIAVGFDRLMLLRHQKKELHEILPFSWHHC